VNKHKLRHGYEKVRNNIVQSYLTAIVSDILKTRNKSRYKEPLNYNSYFLFLLIWVIIIVTQIANMMMVMIIILRRRL